MSDFLVELGRRPAARQLVQTLGLPVPLPQALRREAGPWSEQPLADREAVLGLGGEMTDVLARVLPRAGAFPWVDAASPAFDQAGEAWGRPARLAGEDQGGDLLLLDATGLEAISDLRRLYDFFQPRVKNLKRNGRVVVLGRPAQGSAALAATQAALEGFVRSLAKEIGRKGATANLVRVEPGAEARLDPVLRWLLSPRSAFVTGQPLEVSTSVLWPDEVPTVRPLANATALVTGAARGIGKAIARCLAREGAHVLALDLPGDEAPLSAVAAEIGGTPVLADVTQPETAALIKRALDERGRSALDVVVHNAGVTRDRTLGNLKPNAWELTLAVNLAAVHDLTRALPLAARARVVHLSSIAGIAGNVGQTNYAASKAGVIGLTRALAAELAPRGIAVNAIAPGFIETRLTAAIPVATREVARRLSALSQGGLPADVAEAVTFLASPGAAALSGQTLRVCGGNLVGA